ncbi:MAG: tetratricopeptide repeat protein, partial [Cyclobacteriaceae bacterium]|nr:tetratricopeptide repeat protein [Cyclobacteriaceae bacterium]
GPEAKRRFSTMMIGGIIVVLVIFLSAVFLLIDLWLLKPEKEVEALEKSIAVLPFRNDSPDQENEYFCNGMMEEILDKLQNIGELKVLSRTATDRYRNTKLDHQEIAKELNVNYLLQGSVRKWESKFRVSLQLINAKTGFQIWSDIYEEEMMDVFAVQADIALKVSKELKVILTINEKQQIAATPTPDVTAYDYILRAMDEKWKYWFFHDTVALKNAERLYDKALKLDPNYAPGWVAKGSIYSDIHAESEEYYEENHLDSVFWYCEKASQLDPESPASFLMKAMVYHIRGDIKSAIRNYKKAIKNIEFKGQAQAQAMYRLGYIYIYSKDYQKGISLIRKAVLAAKDSPRDYAYLLYRLAYAYLWMGDYEEAENYYIQSRDMGAWFLAYCYFYFYQADFQATLDCSMHCSPTPSEDHCLYLLGNTYFQLRDFENAVK